MQVAQNATDLLRPATRPRLRNPSRAIYSRDISLLLQNLAQRPSLDKIHDQVVTPLLNEEIAHTGNTRMVEVQQQCRLARKPCDRLVAISIVMKIVQHLFHGAGTIKTYIERAINRSHPASRNRTFYFIAPTGKLCACSKPTTATIVPPGRRGRLRRVRSL